MILAVWQTKGLRPVKKIKIKQKHGGKK